MQERPDLEEQRSQIVVSIATMKHELKEIEDRILLKLSTSEGSPLDDLDFIITLEASKVKSEDIKVCETFPIFKGLPVSVKKLDSFAVIGLEIEKLYNDSFSE